MNLMFYGSSLKSFVMQYAICTNESFFASLVINRLSVCLFLHGEKPNSKVLKRTFEL